MKNAMNIGIGKPARETFVSALRTLTAANIPFLVGGAFAVEHYSGYLRNTKDIDLFLYRRDVKDAMARLEAVGFATKPEWEHWLAKAFKNDNQVNLIYGSGNWVMQVDESFFDRAIGGNVLGVSVRLLAPEEMIWSKSYVTARERFDGSDIAHLINALKGKVDWNHLLDRFGEHWQLLFADLLLYSFIYPSQRDDIPSPIVTELLGRMQQTLKETLPQKKICHGTLLDPFSFIADVETKGYKDAREGFAKKHGYSPERVAEARARDAAKHAAALK